MPNNQVEEFRNEAFVAEDVEKAFRRLFLANAMNTSRFAFSVSDVDLAELAEARARVGRLIEEGFDKLQRMTEVRRRNLAIFDLPVVSLGYDCFSRTLATRWGIKKPNKLGEKTLPFDLSVHSMPTLAAVIKSDFEGYMDPRFLKYSEKQKYCVNTKFNARFNHETGPEYAENDFALLRKAYTARVENFRRIVADAPGVAFIVHLKNGTSADRATLDGAIDVLRQKMGGRPSTFVVMNSYSPEAGPSLDEVNEAGYHIFSVPLPWAGYLWHSPENYLGDQGFAFEAICAERIAERIKHDLL